MADRAAVALSAGLLVLVPIGCMSATPDAFGEPSASCGSGCTDASGGSGGADDAPDPGSGSDSSGAAEEGSTGGMDSGPPPTSSETGMETGEDGDPPVGIDTMCGDWVCQEAEDIASCPFDCVPYEITPIEEGMGLGKVCERTHMGFIPLTEIGPGSYLGQAQGGLYPDGSNERPDAHTDAGIEIAGGIAPIGGKICVISVGMSNTNQKWSMFMEQGLPSVTGLAPGMTAANGAVGSHPVDTTADPGNEVWAMMDGQLADDGCSTDQVQVVWMLHAERGPVGDFMTEADRFYADLKATILNLRDHFPNLAMIYLSSRSYAGYGDKPNNPEPYAFQTAFVVKWIIEAQIDGSDPELALDAGVPWLSWGPYLWSDGLGADDVVGGIPGRQIPDDGLEYECSDLSDADGIHPGQGMREKVSAQLVEFFTTDETAVEWFLE